MDKTIYLKVTPMNALNKVYTHFPPRQGGGISRGERMMGDARYRSRFFIAQQFLSKQGL
jgi:hypothetical protein